MFDAITQTILGLHVVDLIQLLAIVVTVLYLVFAFLVLRQTQLMTRTLPTPIAPFVIFIGILHVGLTFVVLVLLVGIL